MSSNYMSVFCNFPFSCWIYNNQKEIIKTQIRIYNINQELCKSSRVNELAWQFFFSANKTKGNKRTKDMLIA
jgi:hypothetical protein